MSKKHKIEDRGAGIDEDRLLDYIEGRMPPDEEYRLETILESDPFLNDAVEGLAEVKDRAQLRAIAAQINVQLRRQVRSRRRQRRGHKLTEGQGWLMVLIVLLLVLLAWWVIRVAVK